MKQLMESRLFLLLTEKTPTTDLLTKLEQAYGEFAVTLLNKLQQEVNITKLYYKLGFVRLELVEIRDNSDNALKKKCTCFRRQSYFFD